MTGIDWASVMGGVGRRKLEPVEQKRKKGKPAPVAAPAPVAEHVVVVRVYDRAENVATAKVVTK